MPFVALDKDGGERVDITMFKEPKQFLAGLYLMCQDCHTKMYIRDTINVVAHFAHHPRKDGEHCLSGGESPAHMQAKKAMGLRLRSLYPEAKIEFEVRIDNTDGAKYRKVDVLETWEDGIVCAHEIQLSAITTEKLKERTADYRKNNIDVVWWLGSRAGTAENKSFLLQEGGCFGTIRYEGREVEPGDVDGD